MTELVGERSRKRLGSSHQLRKVLLPSGGLERERERRDS